MRTLIMMTPVLVLGCGDPSVYEANLKAEALLLKSADQIDEEDCEVADVYLESSTEDDAVAAELEELCGPGGCKCDCTAATLACRALPTCGNGAVASGIKGNTCSNSDCDAAAACDCETCTEGGQKCDTVATPGACVKP